MKDSHDPFAYLAQIPLPSVRAEQYARLKKEIFALHDRGTGGAPAIHKVLEGRYGPAVCSERYVSNRLKERVTNSEQVGASKEWNRWDSYLGQNDQGLLLRINLIAQTFRHRNLTEDEARITTQLEPSLRDIDEIAQWALVEEYARRHSTTKSPETSDLDLLVSTTPWVGDGSFYQTARHAGHGWLPYIASLESVDPTSPVDLLVALHVSSSLCVPVFLTGEIVTGITPKIATHILQTATGEQDRLKKVQMKTLELVHQRPNLEFAVSEDPSAVITDTPGTRRFLPDIAKWKSVLMDVWAHRESTEQIIEGKDNGN